MSKKNNQNIQKEGPKMNNPEITQKEEKVLEGIDDQANNPTDNSGNDTSPPADNNVPDMGGDSGTTPPVDSTPSDNTPSEQQAPEVPSKPENPKANLTEEEMEENREFLCLFEMATGNKKLPDNIDGVKLVKDVWALKKPGKPFPGFMAAKIALIKMYKELV